MRLKRIVFVDDDARILDGFKRMLRRMADEWDCQYATSADDAWERILADVPDAIVSDLNMPGKSGEELLTMVRSYAPTSMVPFILLTGNNESRHRITCLEKGATDYLNKPCDFTEMVVRLRNALTLKEFQDEVRRQNDILESRVKDRTLELESSQREVILRLARAAELRDSATGRHILRVGLLSRLIAEEIGFDQEGVNSMFLASTLHDIGKLGIADAILLKPAKLTEQEYTAMQAHCRIGADILRDDLQSTFRLLSGGKAGTNKLLELAAEIAETHHERWDGTGYPKGLKGEQIPLSGRVVAVADVFDALCSVRPYKKGLSPNESLEAIREGAGTHFDPTVVGAFLMRQDDAISIMNEHSDSAIQDRSIAA